MDILSDAPEARLFHRQARIEPTAGHWLYLPYYALARLPMTLQLLRPLLRHPVVALRNLRYLAVRPRDRFHGACLGVPSRAALIECLRLRRDDWQAGRRSDRPQLWIFQAYCEKPLRCACAPESDSPYLEPDGQRRFNAGCVLAVEAGGRSCGALEKCRVGQAVHRWEGADGGIDIRVKIMLSERQMADFWEEMMEHQARTGEVIPFVMDVCPLALWLARCSFFQLKTPVGVVFLFESANRCRSWAEYRSADKGRKEAAEPVGLSGAGQAEKEEFLRQLQVLSSESNHR
jgi:hypothetical protein